MQTTENNRHKTMTNHDDSDRMLKTMTVSDVKSLFSRTFKQIEYLRQRQDDGKDRRFVLLSRIASRIAILSNECDLREGYTDAADPFADLSLAVVRSEFAEMTHKASPYPVPMDPAMTPFDQGRYYNGKFLRGGLKC